MPSPKILSPMQQVQQHILRQRLQSLARIVPPAPLRAAPLPFIRVTTPYPAFPAAGAAAVTLLSYTVPAGLNALLLYLAIFTVGSNYVDGSANAIWRVLIDDAGVKGMEGLQSQFGSSSLPLPVAIPLIENSTLKVTVEVPLGQVAPTGTTGVRFHGGAANAPISALAGVGTSTSSSSSSGSGAASPAPGAGGGGGGGGGVTPPFTGGGGGGAPVKGY